MSKYIDANYYCYNSLSECLEHKQGCVFELKQILFGKPKLLIVDKTSGNIVTTIDDTQPIYLYPLSILDYCRSLFEEDISLFSATATINIINFDANINYIDKLSKLDLKKLSNVEIEINEKYNNNELNEIIELINYISANNIKITLLFKTMNIQEDILIKLSLSCDFFKIMMSSILNTSSFKEFNNKLEIVCSNKKDTSVVMIKSYLDFNHNDYYEIAIKVFENLNIDIFMVSKELIPNNAIDNPLVPQKIQDNIRYLENKYNSALGTRFISVKDISTLYYPRFELDERNSRKCYACIMKPYIYKEKFLPCRVNKVITNMNDWYVSNLDNIIKEDNLSKCGIKCDDCASIFENDILNEIETIIKKHKEKNIKFILEMDG